MAGPLPDPKRRRRNAPTIPTTELPVSGRPGDSPEPPEAYELGMAGQAWWTWAWSLPQACAWDDGALYVAARRAQLEDDLLAFDDADHLSSVLDDMIAESLMEESPLNLKQRLTALGLTLKKLKSLAGGRVGVMKEMRELDNRLGLNPKALSDLRWRIVDDGEEAEPPKPASKGRKKPNRRNRLSVVK